MNLLFKVSAFLMCLTLLGFSQIDNVQFETMNGKSYDLHELLGEGKSVYLQMMFNN